MAAPRILHTVAEWRALRDQLHASGQQIGFVPTMGALHEGHGSLFQQAARECPVVLASVFVNPTQFDDTWDYENYPRMLDADSALMQRCGVTHVLAPSAAEMYPNGTRYVVTENDFSKQLCGAHRPGHFDGVLTVVMKLLQIAEADRAYFGEKDQQQLQLIRGMCAAFFMRTQIVACPTIRETDGLAMSSRNARLSSSERALAPQFAHTLRTASNATEALRQLEALGFGVDYIEDREGIRYGAVRLGKTRLIDNVPL